MQCCAGKKKQSVCSLVEAQRNEKALVNASPSAGHLDPEISRCSVVPEKKTKERCMRKMMGKVLQECTYNTWSKEGAGTEL